MGMFNSIFKFELQHWLKQGSVYIYFGVFFLLAFIIQAGTGGFFDANSADAKLGFQQYLNSPHGIYQIFQYFNKFFLFLLPAIIGAGLYRDYKHQVVQLLYTFPIPKKDYLLGKFWSSFLVVFIISLAVVFGLIIAEHLPNLNPNKIGPFNALGFAQIFTWFTLPNLLIFGAITFSIVLWFRNIFVGFASIIVLIMLQGIIEDVLSQHKELLALLDPFAQNTFTYITQHWTIAEQNNNLLPFAKILLFNRLIWLSIAGIIFGWSYYKFDFDVHTFSFSSSKSKDKKAIRVKNNSAGSEIIIPDVAYQYSWRQQVKNVWHLSLFHLGYIVKSWLFLALSIMGILSITFSLAQVTNTNTITLLPVTQIILFVPAFFFNTIIILLTFIYSGMLVQRERSANMDALVDATAINTGTTLLAKALAIIKMQAILLGVMLLAGVLLQTYNGYFNYEFGLYFFHLFVVQFVVVIIWAFTSIFAHTLIPNVYLGMFLLILAWLGFNGIKDFGIETQLLHFNSPDLMRYSDMNGYGHSLKAYFIKQAYWLCTGLLLLMGSYLFWQRGLTNSFKEKIQLARSRNNIWVTNLSVIFFLGFLSFGFVIFQGEKSALNLKPKAQQKAFANFTKNFVQYQNISQPKITAVDLQLDLFPEENNFAAKGHYKIINQTNAPIDTLLIKLGFDEINTFNINRPSRIIDKDDYVQFYVVKLGDALRPKDSLELYFNVANKPNNLFERNSSVLANGTFLKQDVLPHLGYFLNSGTKHPSDSTATKNNYQAIDSDLINLTTQISTSQNQVALAPGYLQKEWTENERNYYIYKTEKPIKFSIGFNSGKFKIAKDKWKDIDLEIYHHPTHNYNIADMMMGLKGALNYNTKFFSPYQHQQARIIEFPNTEGSYATTYANSIPTSETRFIANSGKDNSKIDFAFYVPAHELTHQWFGNQLIPADALGASMLTESITEYITLQIYQQTLGEKKANDFLKIQRKRYLRGRKRKTKKEMPLQLVTTSNDHIAYGKGAIAFNTLKHYLGEAQLNKVLQSFLLQYQFTAAPYPTSLQLVQQLKAACPDSLQYLIADNFESVVLYDNKIETATVTALEDGKQEVNLQLLFKKSKISEGATNNLLEEVTTFNEYLEIGFYDTDDVLIHLAKQHIMKARNTLKIQLDQVPAKVVLDPNLLLIDKELKDNEVGF